MADFLKMFLSQFQIETGWMPACIVCMYRGFLTVLSSPGKTCFQAGLPLQRTGAY
jgi:hypothetical protein